MFYPNSKCAVQYIHPVPREHQWPAGVTKIYSVCSSGEWLPVQENFDNSIILSIDYVNEKGEFLTPSSEQRLHHYKDHDGPVECLEISPTAKFFAASTEDRCITIWSWDDFSSPYRDLFMGMNDYNGEFVKKIVFFHSEERVAASDKNSIVVWDLHSGMQIHSLDGVLWGASPDRGLYVQWCYDDDEDDEEDDDGVDDDERLSLGLWDPSTDAIREIVNFGMFDKKWEKHVVVSDDGTSTAMLAKEKGSDQFILEVWRLADAGSAVLSVKINFISDCLSISPDGKFVTCFVREGLRTWRVRDGACVTTVQDAWQPSSIVYSPEFIILCNMESTTVMFSPNALAKKHREALYSFMSVLKKEGEKNSVSRDVYGLGQSIGGHIYSMIQDF